MKTKSKTVLPKTEPLPGSVCVQWRRCGKSNCRCAVGTLHGPYFYRFWREAGKLRKEYIKVADVPAMREACLLHRQQQADLRQQIQRGRREFRELLRLFRSL